MLVYFCKKNYNMIMGKRLSFFLLSIIVASNCVAATNFMPKKFTTVTSHEDVYPYRLNNSKAEPIKNISSTKTNAVNSVSPAPIGKRKIVKRNVRARAATTNANTNAYYQNDVPQPRRVVPRSNSKVARAATNNVTSNPRVSNERTTQTVSARKEITSRATTSDANYSYGTRVSSQRCFADYKECMEMYCRRKDTAYNRCYCSAKLSQIDAKYQNKIDSLIQQIVRLKYNTPEATSEEIKEYWDQTIGVYTKDNPWVNIDNALNIEWADSQSRIRGQNAFNTGHDYCIQHLRACSYMASNMRDAYKSEITRDCEKYEKDLQKIQNAAESVIESYKN